MASSADQKLMEIVEVADVAIRVASQLRLAKRGKAPSDLQSIGRGIEFLKRAKTGSVFMMGQQAASLGFDGTLTPLNWATDTYQVTFRRPVAQEPDYGQVAGYIGRIEACLESIPDSFDISSSSFDDSIVFFETLGDILSTRADQQMRRRSSSFTPEI